MSLLTLCQSKMPDANSLRCAECTAAQPAGTPDVSLPLCVTPVCWPQILDKGMQDLETTRGTLQPQGAIPMRCKQRASSQNGSM